MSRLHQCTEETLSQCDNTWKARLVAQLDTAIVSTQAYAYAAAVVKLSTAYSLLTGTGGCTSEEDYVSSPCSCLNWPTLINTNLYYLYSLPIFCHQIV